MSSPRFAIAGGGIGGLSAALALGRAGYRVQVFEQSPEFSEIGAGIQLGPNAFFCFRELGIFDEASRDAVQIERVQIMDALTERELVGFAVDDAFRQRYGNTYAVVHRGDLHAVLLAACRECNNVELHTHHKIKTYRQDATGLTLEFHDQPDRCADALIGADGLHSVVRAQVVGDGAPRVSGHASYRALIPADRMPESLRWNSATLWAGPKCHVVHYPLKGSEVYNLVVTYHNDAPAAVSGKPVPDEEVQRGFAHIATAPRELVMSGRDWKLWVLCDRDPVDNWIDGAVVLLGDAAHPMLQYLAQGACMAMEDAVCLGAAMAKHNGNICAGFAAYQQARVVRTARVQMYSRLIGDHLYHPSGVAARVRNQALGNLDEAAVHQRIAWLYAATALDEFPAG